jgi:hypothetical protein
LASLVEEFIHRNAQFMFQQSLMKATPSTALNLKESGFSERDYLTKKIRGSADPTARCRTIGTG